MLTCEKKTPSHKALKKTLFHEKKEEALYNKTHLIKHLINIIWEILKFIIM